MGSRGISIASGIVVLALTAILAATLGHASAADAEPSDGSHFSRCVAAGLRPIPAKVSLFLAGDSVTHSPTLKVTWSGKPLPKKCGMHTVLAVRARVDFPRGGHVLEFGPDRRHPWSIFWLGRTHVENAEQEYHGPIVTFSLGCVEKPQAWLRYEVDGRGERTFATAVRRVHLTSEICQRTDRRTLHSR